MKPQDPPNLRDAKGVAKRCGTCKMYWQGRCWGYGEHMVWKSQLCDSWTKDPNRQQRQASSLS